MLIVKDNEQVESTPSILIVEYHSKHTATCTLTEEDGQCSREERMVLSTRGWKDYVNGFGDLNGEHWLGLEKIYRLTKSTSLLRVDMTSYVKGSKYAKYSNFKVGNSASKYTLHVSGYSGNAGDSLKYHSGMKFATKDNKNNKFGKKLRSFVYGSMVVQQMLFKQLERTVRW